MNRYGDIKIYQTNNNDTRIEVRFQGETVWLSLNQLSRLFNRDKSVISRHLTNIYDEGELDKEATVAKNATVQMEAGRKVKRNIEYYNLDAIISVGYRVNSIQGTRFRKWATQHLNDYLLKGYAINKKRLDELGTMVDIIEQSRNSMHLQLEEAKGLLDIFSLYTKSFVLLNEFDKRILSKKNLDEKVTYELSYIEAKQAIIKLKEQLISKNQATVLFGKEKDDGFKSSLKSVVQTFDGKYLYPSIEEQAANLLYFVIKNHSFVDGNKRIGSFLFMWFLEKNKHRFKKSGELKINDNGLTALTLLIAQSNPSEKESMINLIINLINDP